MMRLSCLEPLRALAAGEQPYLKNQGYVRRWLYGHALMIYDYKTHTCILTAKGRHSLNVANAEYESRPNHCQPRKWLRELRESHMTPHPPMGVLTVAQDVSPEKLEEFKKAWHKALDNSDRAPIIQVGVDFATDPPITVIVHKSPDGKFIHVEGSDVSDRGAPEPTDDAVIIEGGRAITKEVLDHAYDVIVKQFGQPSPVAPIPRDPRGPDHRLPQIAGSEQWPQPARDNTISTGEQFPPAQEPVDELTKKRQEKQGVDTRQYIVAMDVLNTYREIAQEIGNFGQGVEEVFVGKLYGLPMQFNPFIPHDALMMLPDHLAPTLIQVGYDVAKALIMKEPPNAVVFSGHEDLIRRRGARCWRCAGTGNLSRNYLIQDGLCPQCKGKGWEGGQDAK